MYTQWWASIRSKEYTCVDSVIVTKHLDLKLSLQSKYIEGANM